MIIGYVLLALGVAVFVISFLIPAKTEEEKEIEFSEEMIKELVGKEVMSAKEQLNGIVDETVSYAMEKTERSIDRLTNERMMAVTEYSDTVLSEISKNHQEVVFLYDMLNDKHDTIKDAVSEVEKTTAEVKQAVTDARLTAEETKEQVREAKEQAKKAMEQAEMAAEEKTADSFTSFSEMKNDPFEVISPSAIIKASEPASDAGASKRPSAIERLKAAKAESDSQNMEIIEEDKTEAKPARKKRTPKPKAREEIAEGTEIPNLNLGQDPVGGTLGGRSNKDKILELHNAGKSNTAIAKELGLGIGEVKLVINLYEGA